MSTVPPEILPFSFPEEVKEGQLIQVSCAVTVGDDPVTLRWYKDGRELVSSPDFRITNVESRLSLLLLRSVGGEHRGSYSCHAFNAVGSAKFTALLNVKGITFKMDLCVTVMLLMKGCLLIMF